MTDDTVDGPVPPPPHSPLTLLVQATTLEEQVAGANAVWSSCFGIQMVMRDARTGDPVGFGEAWPDRADTLSVEVTCEGQRAAFRPLGPDPVFILMRE